MVDPTNPKLTYRLRDQMLWGMVNAKALNSPTQRPDTAGISVGRYRLYPPVHHSTLGLVIVVVPVADDELAAALAVQSGAVNTVNNFSPQLSAALTTGYTLSPVASNTAAVTAGVKPVVTTGVTTGVTYTLSPQAGAALTQKPFVLAAKTLDGINSVTVLSGFDELANALTKAGSGTLEVVA